MAITWSENTLDDVELADLGWQHFHQQQRDQDYYRQLTEFLAQEMEVYYPDLQLLPPLPSVYQALNYCPLDKIQVVILGQDPYHQIGQAMGLAFSVPKGVKLPPSLRNIYKELHSDLGIDSASHGDLTTWAKQGVLLLNTSLTVRQHCANSHCKYWRHYTDNLISYLSNQRQHLVFMLWGRPARNKKILIDGTKHLILEAPHPSPLARGGFFGCRHFSRCNQHLREQQKPEIDWNLT